MSSLTVSNERLAFLEMLVFWMGIIRNKDLEHQFGISRQQAYKDLTQYQQLHPNGLIKIEKACYAYRDGAELHYFNGGLDDFLLWLETGNFAALKPLSNTFTSRLKLPERHASRHIVAALVRAIQQRLRIEVNYVSLSNPEEEGRILSPHSIVKAGSRFHVRGYCEKSKAYRDFVLSRFSEEIQIEGPSPYSIEQDVAWQTNVTLILSPDPRLTAAQSKVLANDFKMENGQLHISTRAALADYLLKEMQVNTKYLDGKPEAQQLVLVNRDDIKQWLFNS